MNKVLRCHFVILVLTSASVFGQDIPLFTQKLSNSFIYNPAVAGLGHGSLTYSYRKNYAGVEGAPENHFLSVHTPFMKYQAGLGASIFQEDVTFLRNTYASIAFAYHLHFTRLSTLSMGVSGEFNKIGLNGNSNFITEDPELYKIANGDAKSNDFSFGINYQNPFLKVGFAMNRLSTAWIKDEKDAILSNYFSGYAQGIIPLRGGDDVLEPYVAFRRFSETSDTYDIGLFYTYSSKLLVGAAVRKGSVINGTVGIKLSKYIMLGYSREMILSNIGGFVGSANEIALRFDFKDQGDQTHFRSDYKSAVTYRRKTLSSKVTKPGGRDPKKLRKKQKRLAPYSPNKRYQNVKKLSKGTKAKGRKFNTAKRQRKNYQRRHKKRK